MKTLRISDRGYGECSHKVTAQTMIPLAALRSFLSKARQSPWFAHNASGLRPRTATGLVDSPEVRLGVALRSCGGRPFSEYVSYDPHMTVFLGLRERIGVSVPGSVVGRLPGSEIPKHLARRPELLDDRRNIPKIRGNVGSPKS